jgi:hypothetical protein
LFIFWHSCAGESQNGHTRVFLFKRGIHRNTRQQLVSLVCLPFKTLFRGSAFGEARIRYSGDYSTRRLGIKQCCTDKRLNSNKFSITLLRIRLHIFKITVRDVNNCARFEECQPKGVGGFDYKNSTLSNTSKNIPIYR